MIAAQIGPMRSLGAYKSNMMSDHKRRLKVNSAVSDPGCVLNRLIGQLLAKPAALDRARVIFAEIVAYAAPLWF